MLSAETFLSSLSGTVEASRSSSSSGNLSKRSYDCPLCAGSMLSGGTCQGVGHRSYWSYACRPAFCEGFTFRWKAEVLQVKFVVAVAGVVVAEELEAEEGGAGVAR